jgi:hypothetical protein
MSTPETSLAVASHFAIIIFEFPARLLATSS